MSLKLRLIIIINSLILISILIGLFLIVKNSHENIRSEIISSKALASYAINQSIQKDPGYIKYLQQNQSIGLSELVNVRHLKIDYYDKNGTLIESNSRLMSNQPQSPFWFDWLLKINQTKNYIPEKIPLNISGRNLGFILLTPDPTSEFAEIWNQFQSGIVATIVFVILLNISIYFLFSRMLTPIDQLVNAFEELSRKNFNIKVPRVKILEFNELRKKFNQLATTLKKNHSEITKLNQAIIDIQEDEKRSISRDLHDDFAQSLAAIQAEAYVALLSKELEYKDIRLKAVMDMTKTMIIDLKNLMQRLSLGILDDIGIEAAIEDLIQSWVNKNNYSNANINLMIPEQINKFQSKEAANIYRIIQECLNNISKHSQPNKINISIGMKSNCLEMVFLNNGIKKNNKTTSSKLGLVGLRERVTFLKGTLSVKKLNKEFKVAISIPLKTD